MAHSVPEGESRACLSVVSKKDDRAFAEADGSHAGLFRRDIPTDLGAALFVERKVLADVRGADVDAGT
jgi:hypothetical protein